MIIITDLVMINHMISVFVTLPYLLSTDTPQLITILNLKFEQVQFTTHCCV